MRALIVIVLGLLSSANVAAKPQERLEAAGVSFVVPTGWKARPMNGAVRLFSEKLPPDRTATYIAFLPTVPLKGAAAEWMLGNLQETVDFVEDSGVIVGRTKNGDKMVSQEVVVFKGGRRLWRGYYMVVLDGKLSGVLLSAESRPLFQEGVAAAKAVVESMQPAGR